MNRYFSIGEMSKLHNISIETLRHYDRIGLLKPIYINEKSKYRYYSTKHFLTIDLIKQCKAMGLSLEEIKDVIGNYTSLESILEILTNQKEIIDRKIEELSNIKNSINSIEDKIKDSLDKGINQVFIKHNKERKFIQYNYTGRYTEEFEMKLRKTLLDVEKNYGNLTSHIVFTTSYEDVKNENKLIYTETLIHIDNDISYEEKVITLPEGNYITLYFDDDYYDNRKYYHKIIDYINKNNIEVIGDFHEIYIMTRVGAEGEEKSLAQIEILISTK